MILEAGFIVPDPDLPDSERWKTSRGPDYYPYARHLNGVSLFDFKDFDPVAYSAACPLSSWWTFVPIREGWEASIWIEIDKDEIEGIYIGCDALVSRWKAESARQHTLMPGIEAAVIGRIPVSAFRQVYRASNSHFQLLNV